jgi:hypothetical protein
MAWKRILLASLTLVATPFFSTVAQACGWYAISVCSRNYQGAEIASERYGGRVVDTDDFENFAGGYFCAVVGPKTKEAAEITAYRMRSRGAYDAYIKHSC